MKKSKIYLLVFSLVFLAIVFIGYKVLQKEAPIEFQKTEGFTVEANAVQKIRDLADIRFIKKAFRKAKKVPGIVDVAEPDYFIKINNVEYYLSVSEDFEEGSIMKKNDTHTLYTIPSGPKILEILEQTH